MVLQRREDEKKAFINKITSNPILMHTIFKVCLDAINKYEIGGCVGDNVEISFSILDFNEACDFLKYIDCLGIKSMPNHAEITRFQELKILISAKDASSIVLIIKQYIDDHNKKKKSEESLEKEEKEREPNYYLFTFILGYLSGAVFGCIIMYLIVMHLIEKSQ